MAEVWIQWKPVDNLAMKYYVKTILNNAEGFKVILSEARSSSHEIIMSFPNVDAFRSTEELFSLLTLNEIGEKYGKQFYDWTFFKINQSRYMQQISEQSKGVSESCHLVHYCIYAINFMVDIISSDQPVVFFSNKN